MGCLNMLKAAVAALVVIYCIDYVAERSNRRGVVGTFESTTTDKKPKPRMYNSIATVDSVNTSIKNEMPKPPVENLTMNSFRTILTKQPNPSTASSAPSRSPLTEDSIPFPACEYNKAIGTFVEKDMNGTMPRGAAWLWRMSNPEQCPVRDYIHAMVSSTKNDNYETTLETHVPKIPATFLVIGDSLDRLMVDYFCKLDPALHIVPQFWKRHPNDHLDWHNKGQWRDSTSRICTNGNISLAHLHICGMYHACDNSGYFRKMDSRTDPNHTLALTADYVRDWLPVDVFSWFHEQEQQYLDVNIKEKPTGDPAHVKAVLLSSSLWDLSSGCNNHAGVNEAYKELYIQGIRDLFRAVQQLLPNVPVYWRTSPPLGTRLDRSNQNKGWGRTRSNQRQLNDILRDTVERDSLGTVVDYWNQLITVPTKVLDRDAPDGKHYNANRALAFLNLWFNAVFQLNPHLLV